MRSALICLLLSTVCVWSQPFTPAFLASLQFSTLNNDLLGYWTLNETNTNNRLDSSGSGLTMTAVSTVTNQTGLIGNAVKLNGSSAYLTRADDSVISVTNNFTWSVWVRPVVLTGNQMIVAKDNGGTSREYLLYRVATNIEFFVWDHVSGAAISVNTSGASAPNRGPMNTNNWHLIEAWYDSSDKKVRLMVNNAEIVVSSGALANYPKDSTNALRFGAYGAAAPAYFNGAMDETSFYKRVLSVAERTELYNSRTGVTCCPFP